MDIRWCDGCLICERLSSTLHLVHLIPFSAVGVANDNSSQYIHVLKSHQFSDSSFLNSRNSIGEFKSRYVDNENSAVEKAYDYYLHVGMRCDLFGSHCQYMYICCKKEAERSRPTRPVPTLRCGP